MNGMIIATIATTRSFSAIVLFFWEMWGDGTFRIYAADQSKISNESFFPSTHRDALFMVVPTACRFAFD